MELPSHLFPVATDIDTIIPTGDWMGSDKQKCLNIKVQTWHFSQLPHDKARFDMTRPDDPHNSTD